MIVFTKELYLRSYGTRHIKREKKPELQTSKLTVWITSTFYLVLSNGRFAEVVCMAMPIVKSIQMAGIIVIISIMPVSTEPM